MDDQTLKAANVYLDALSVIDLADQETDEFDIMIRALARMDEIGPHDSEGDAQIIVGALLLVTWLVGELSEIRSVDHQVVVADARQHLERLRA